MLLNKSRLAIHFNVDLQLNIVQGPCTQSLYVCCQPPSSSWDCLNKMIQQKIAAQLQNWWVEELNHGAFQVFPIIKNIKVDVQCTASMEVSAAFYVGS